MIRIFSAILFVCFVFPSQPLSAKCISGYTWAFPEKSVRIPSNATVMITLYGRDIKSFDASKKLYFRSGKHRVEAIIENSLSSEFGLKALLVRASKPLKKGRRYRLKINGKTFRWKIGKADTVKPLWEKDPVFSGFTEQHYGCGPAVNFSIDQKVEDSSPLIYNVLLVDPQGNRQQFYILNKDPTQAFKIGHGMCSGGFVPKRNTKYEVEITPIDLGGNRGETRKLSLFKEN